MSRAAEWRRNLRAAGRQVAMSRTATIENVTADPGGAVRLRFTAGSFTVQSIRTLRKTWVERPEYILRLGYLGGPLLGALVGLVALGFTLAGSHDVARVLSYVAVGYFVLAGLSLVGWVEKPFAYVGLVVTVVATLPLILLPVVRRRGAKDVLVDWGPPTQVDVRTVAEVSSGHHQGRDWVSVRFVHGSRVTYWVDPGRGRDLVKRFHEIRSGLPLSW